MYDAQIRFERAQALRRGQAVAKGTWFYEAICGGVLGVAAVAYIVLPTWF